MTQSQPRTRDLLEKIEKIIADRERTLTLPDVKDTKKIWNIARDALAHSRPEGK